MPGKAIDSREIMNAIIVLDLMALVLMSAEAFLRSDHGGNQTFGLDSGISTHYPFWDAARLQGQEPFPVKSTCCTSSSYAGLMEIVSSSSCNR